MSGIPVHVQRSFEQRWAAKLASSGASARSKAIDLKGTVNSLPRPATAKETNDDQHSISGGLVRRLSCLAARVVFNALALVLGEVSDGKCGTCRARSHVRGASRKSDRSARQHYREMAAYYRSLSVEHQDGPLECAWVGQAAHSSKGKSPWIPPLRLPSAAWSSSG